MLDHPEEYAHRRARLLAAMPKNSIAIINAAKECARNSDCYYPYRQNSDFYYLTGFKEPEAIAVFVKGRSDGEFILFNRAPDPLKERWDGPRIGQEQACRHYGADQSFNIEMANQQIPALLENQQRLYYAIGTDMAFNRRVLSWLAVAQKKQRSGVKAPEEFLTIEKIIHPLRLRKSPQEIALMRKAASISAQAHCRAMLKCQPGLYEYELEAEIQYEFTKQGSRAPAYNHIVAAGANSCFLHYNDNNAKVADGDLVLIDAGAEYASYAADITRTFPANGRFSTAQAAVYQAVLNTQLAVIAAIKPGVPWGRLQEISEQTITQELVDLGLLAGDVNELVAQNACQAFYMHRIGHWLGLDVHDVGSYKDENGQWRLLEPGMTLTVEPGLYIPANSAGVDPRWWNIGVRIEDDIVVTETGYEILSAAAPTTIAAIEALMALRTI